MKRIMVCLAMLTFASMAPRTAAAECCDHCGCQCQCSKVCRLVPDVKKVPKVTYACECEDICIPGKSCIIGYKCDTDDCESGHHRPAEPIWQPSCGRVITRHKLVRTETVKEVKTFKCVVVNLCPHCCAQNEDPGKSAGNLAAHQPAEAAVANVAEAQPKSTADAVGDAGVQLASHDSDSPGLIDRLKRSFQPILGK